MSAAVAVARLRQSGHQFSEGNSAITWTAVFLVVDIFLLLSVGALSVTQVRLSSSDASTLALSYYPRTLLQSQWRQPLLLSAGAQFVSGTGMQPFHILHHLHKQRSFTDAKCEAATS